MKEYTGLEIAVIGMAGRFPGAGDINLFWNNLKSGIEAVSFFTDEELLQSGVDEKLINNPLYVKANALLQEKEYFDSTFFKYRPDEAKLMDPQMRIFHECVWSALEDAAVDLESKNMKAGVFAGSSGNINWELYARLMNRNSLVDDFTASLLSNPRFLATRISYILNLCGPAIYIDSACSTSLVAVNQACKSLLMGECNLAIAGGVTITEKGKVGYLYKDDMIQSRDGHSRTFDAAASGTVGGEGVGVVILKTLKNALKDGDHIWALIKGTATNNDGNYKVGYSAPSINGQAEAIKMAHKWSKVPAESISYVEAHGTGTKLGDPVEVEALNQAFGNNKEKYCALGSVKTNIGHLDAAAGIAGLIKTVLSLKHRQIPPSLNFSKANEAINFKNGPFYVNTKLTEWKNDKYPLRAGLSSFGIGGTNAHVVLEEAPDTTKTSTGREYKVLVLSGKTVGALERNKQNLMTFLKENEDINLADVAHTLQRGRCAFKYRSAIVCRNTGEAIAQLADSQVNNNKTIIEAATSPMLVFMFPGQGSQYLGMCKELYGKEACFREEADKCFEIIKKKYNRDIREVIFGQDDKSIDNTINTQPALFVMEYALARCLISWGINPGLMIGQYRGICGCLHKRCVFSGRCIIVGCKTRRIDARSVRRKDAGDINNGRITNAIIEGPGRYFTGSS
jgi:acyl transferase domain-containing protein